MYDYYLGGSANFDVDRQAVHEILLVMPEMQASAQMNRRFLRRAVQFLLRCGVRRFLDLGSGVPTVGNVHEIAFAVDPSCRVAVAHGRRLLSGYEHVTVTEAAIRDPQQVLSAPGVSGLLDFAELVAVLMVAVLHFVPRQDNAAEIVRQYRQACAPGSGLALSHGSTDFPQQSDQLQRFQEIYSNCDHLVTLRTRPEIVELFAGTELSPPGLVPLPLSGAEDPEGTRTEHSPSPMLVLASGRAKHAVSQVGSLDGCRARRSPVRSVRPGSASSLR